MSYKLKYTGQQVEEYLERVASGQGGCGTEDYNDLKNKPIINADLANLSPSAAKQTVLYHHVGESTSVYEKNVLYYTNGESWLQFKGETPNIAVSATVDNSEGTPSVEVTKSGTNENPSFAFNFHNLKGETGKTGATGAPGPTGATGATPNITMTADVVGTTGEPYVDVFKGETPPEQPTYTFVFHNLKGEPGEPGPTGENGKDGRNGKDGNATFLCRAEITQNTAGISTEAITILPGRSIQINDILISTATATFGAMSQVTGLSETVITVKFIGTLKSNGGSGGSGGSGGTTLNRYQLYLYVSSLQSKSLLLYKIYTQAKGRVSICEFLYNNSSDFNYTEYTPYFISNSSIRLFCISGQQGSMYIQALSSESGTRKRDYATIESNKTISNAGSTSWDGQIKIIYYNDTEITE